MCACVGGWLLHLNKGCDVCVCVFACNIVCVCYTLRRVGMYFFLFLVFGGKEDGEDDFFLFRPFSQLAPKQSLCQLSR